MDNTSRTDFEARFAPAATPTARDDAARRPGVVGIAMRVLLAVGVLAFAGFQTFSLIGSRPAPPARQNIERSFTVNAVVPIQGAHSADIRTFGQVVATRTIEMRSQVQGRVVEVSPEFASGNTLESGALIARIDPYSYQGALITAQAQLADAELSLRESREAYRLEEQNIEAAEEALAAARTDLERARTLLGSGAATQQTVDTRALTVSERQQALSQRRGNLFTLQAQIDRQTALIEQARWTIETARRDLANTEIRAPFGGVVTAANITEGAHVTANEVIGALYETASLNVRFTISDQQYGDLSAAGLAGRPVTASWALRPAAISIPGAISRTAPEIDPTTGGVELYATLDPDAARAIRPGAFVSVTIEGTAYPDSIVVPETAVYDDDHLYVIREGRMARVDVEILARDNDRLIVSADLPERARIITTRLAQAGEGVAVRIEGEGPRPGGPGFMGPPGGPGPMGPR